MASHWSTQHSMTGCTSTRAEVQLSKAEAGSNAEQWDCEWRDERLQYSTAQCSTGSSNARTHCHTGGHSHTDRATANPTAHPTSVTSHPVPCTPHHTTPHPHTTATHPHHTSDNLNGDHLSLSRNTAHALICHTAQPSSHTTHVLHSASPPQTVLQSSLDRHLPELLLLLPSRSPCRFTIPVTP